MNILVLLGENDNTVYLLVENKPKKELIRMLQQMGYDSDPVKSWKQAQEKVGQSGPNGIRLKTEKMNQYSLVTGLVLCLSS